METPLHAGLVFLDASLQVSPSRHGHVGRPRSPPPVTMMAGLLGCWQHIRCVCNGLSPIVSFVFTAEPNKTGPN